MIEIGDLFLFGTLFRKSVLVVQITHIVIPEIYRLGVPYKIFKIIQINVIAIRIHMLRMARVSNDI